MTEVAQTNDRPGGIRLTCDVGGTFTDVVAADPSGRAVIGKSLTTPGRLVDGVRNALTVAATELALEPEELLSRADLFVYGTTQATNAILERKTAKTALLCTEGFPDILVRREGGSMHPYDFNRPPLEPYVPRRLTFEVRERIGANGEVVTPLDLPQAREALRSAGAREVEAIAVCLLWSVANPEHERRLGELIADELPGVPFTLSHQLNPIVREYRRASCAAIDASLKPLMQSHLREIEIGLEELGFVGELVAATSFGGILPMAELAERPIYAVRSGPSLAPVAGRVYADAELNSGDVIVCDTGGTSFDVSLIRDGLPVFTRETWLGEPFEGHLTGLSSVDVHSIGAGGGSIAYIDSGGLLRVGPLSAGADPGPACYGRGGSRATVTDAAVVLGYLDPDHFLGGAMQLDVEAAREAIREVGQALEMELEPAAHAIVTVANEHMIAAIREITIDQGVDPRESVVVAGGGAAGLGIAAISRELGCERVLIPRTAGALSAFGGQQADVVSEFGRSLFTQSGDFAYDEVNGTLTEIDASLEVLGAALRARGIGETRIEHFVEARYAHQVWDLEIPLPAPRFSGEGELSALVDSFHATHERVFAVKEPGQQVETTYWKGRLVASPSKPPLTGLAPAPTSKPRLLGERRAYFTEQGETSVPVLAGGSFPPGHRLEGPALIAEPTTTVVLPPGASALITELGNYLLETA